MSRDYKKAPDQNRAAGARRQGHTGIHKDMSGNIIGGYDADGVAYGTKTGVQGYRSIPAQVAVQQQVVAQPGQQDTKQQPAVMQSGGTKPAYGTDLNQRKALFSEMEKAGYENITPEMRQKARGLGVQDQDFNRAVSRIKENSAYSGAKSEETKKQEALKAKQEAAKQGGQQQAGQQQAATRIYKQPQEKLVVDSEYTARRQGIRNFNEKTRAMGLNPSTGMKPGTLPGDEGYIVTKGAAEDMRSVGIDPPTGNKALAPDEQQAATVKEQMRQENNKRILADHYAKTGKPDPRGVQPVSRPYKTAMPAPKNTNLPASPASTASNPAGSIASTIKSPAPATPAVSTPAPAPKGYSMNSDYGGATSWKKPQAIGDAVKSDIQSGIVKTGNKAIQGVEVAKNTAQKALNVVPKASDIPKMINTAKPVVSNTVDATKQTVQGVGQTAINSAKSATNKVASVTPGDTGRAIRYKTRGW